MHSGRSCWRSMRHPLGTSQLLKTELPRLLGNDLSVVRQWLDRRSIRGLWCWGSMPILRKRRTPIDISHHPIVLWTKSLVSLIGHVALCNSRSIRHTTRNPTQDSAILTSSESCAQRFAAETSLRARSTRFVWRYIWTERPTLEHKD